MIKADRPVVVIQGAAHPEEVPGIERVSQLAHVRAAADTQTLREALEGAEILLGWDFRAGNLEQAWGRADQLRWIHWAGVGVDALLFPALVESDVVLTNSSGVFRRAMAEYALGLILAFSKGFPETIRLQLEREWGYRLTERIQGKHALLIGVGSIGREIASLLKAAGMAIKGVGRHAREGDPTFGQVHAIEELHQHLPWADYVIAVLPLTEETHHILGRACFEAMDPGARFINLGRGATVDEGSLHQALECGELAGAALDCFEEEPLPPESPLWAMENVIISPHMSGDYEGHTAALADMFFENFNRYKAGEPLFNVVDKKRGYIPG
jgi:phosphoglycerate dehydrogenase-like enzyme